VWGPLRASRRPTNLPGDAANAPSDCVIRSIDHLIKGTTFLRFLVPVCMLNARNIGMRVLCCTTITVVSRRVWMWILFESHGVRLCS
jgi:hypothetical protein